MKSELVPRAACAVALMAAWIQSSGVVIASSGDLILAVTDQPCTVSADAAEAGIKRQRAVLLDAAVPLHAQPNDVLTLRLFGDAAFEFVVERRLAIGEGGEAWVGRLARVPGSAVTLVHRAGHVAAAIHAGMRGSFEIRSLGDGRHLVREMDVPLLRTCGTLARPDEHTDFQPPAPVGAAAVRSITSELNCDDGTVIDILIVYTSDARAAAGGTLPMETAIDMAVADANAAFDRSEIDTSLRLVRTQEVNYVETGDWEIDGPRLVHQNDGFLDIVHPLRDQHGADCVSLITNTLNAGGIGFFPLLSPGGADSSGFSIVRRDNLALGTLAHEIGHNLFCAHDRPNAPDLPFAEYSYGFVEPGGAWQTIMAVSATAYIPHFANPSVNWPGPSPPNPGPTGVPVGQADPSDIALTINETRHLIANFRATHVPGLPAVLHARADANPGGDGISWITAFDDLTNAMCAGDGSGGAVQEIWVKSGTYKADRGSGDRAAVFRLREGMAIYGGFDGTETSRDERDWAVNVTVLSGDIGAAGDASDNCYHVVDGSQSDASAVLDGFVITRGNADGVDPHDGGGGVLVYDGGSPTIRNCAIVGNQALRFGGGVYNFFNSSPSFIDCTIASNGVSGAVWPEGGGGVYNYTSSPVLAGCTLTANSGMFGSGMVNVFGSSPSLSGCTIENNVGPAGSEGGGVYGYSNCSPTLDDCVIRDNAADLGGGMINWFGSSPTLSSCVLEGNVASADGGAMYNYAESSAELIDCLINSNSAAFGGGLSNFFTSGVKLTSCILMGNSASPGDGGALYNHSGSNVELVNCLLSGNSAAFGGAIINLFDSNVQVVNSTLVGNEASVSGGGVHVHESSPVLVNSILWANTINSIGSEEAQLVNFNGTVTIDFCTVQNWSGALGGANNDGADPLFVDADGTDDTFGTADDNARLTAASPAIDTGSNGAVPTGTVTDLAGADRIVNGSVDRGAYEFSPAPGDVDGDGDVDLDDYALLVDCSAGPGNTPAPQGTTTQLCIAVFDFDGDEDVDLQDSGAFARAFDSP